MLYYSESGEQFASGVTTYDYRPATAREETPRIIVSVILDDFQTLAFVDTGGVYGICSPEIAEELNIDPAVGAEAEPLQWRGDTFRGTLHRIPMTLVAEEGESLRIEPTFFVPQLKLEQVWVEEMPCILGMYCCLERTRFAVDPGAEKFYFGELS